MGLPSFCPKSSCVCSTSGLPAELAGAQVLSYLTEDDAWDILFAADGKDAHIFPLGGRFFEVQGRGGFADVDRGEAAFHLGQIGDYRLQVGDLHIGNEKDVGSAAAGFMAQLFEILQGERGACAKVAAERLVDTLAISGKVKQEFIPRRGITKVVHCHLSAVA